MSTNFAELRRTIKSKSGLQAFYRQSYVRFLEVLKKCSEGGSILELGSGGGFIKEIVPETITSDVTKYDGVDRHIDARALPFKDNELRAILMLNVFHHIPDVGKFLSEAERALKPGGRILIIDQNLGWFSYWILKYFHNENFSTQAKDWSFPEGDPLETANGALAWIVFSRDYETFSKQYPHLKLVSQKSHTPLLYWFTGGMKNWNLCPGPLFHVVDALDKTLISLNKNFGSFIDIEIEKI